MTWALSVAFFSVFAYVGAREFWPEGERLTAWVKSVALMTFGFAVGQFIVLVIGLWG